MEGVSVLVVLCCQIPGAEYCRHSNKPEDVAVAAAVPIRSAIPTFATGWAKNRCRVVPVLRTKRVEVA